MLHMVPTHRRCAPVPVPPAQRFYTQTCQKESTPRVACDFARVACVHQRRAPSSSRRVRNRGVRLSNSTLRGAEPRLARMLGLFKSAPPPPPPPESPESFSLSLNAIIVTVSTISGLTLIFSVVAAFYIRRRWRSWSTQALDACFKKTDLDKSGKINSEELYIAVLEMYLMLNQFGAKVRAPKRKTLLVIMKDLGRDGSGEIDRKEFRYVIERLLAQQSTRIATNIGLTVLCPLTASFVSAGLRTLVVKILLLFMTELPAMPALIARLPDSTDETIICGIMMGSINPTLALIDYLYERFWVFKHKQP